jgi:hypothetical protein
MAKAKKAPKSKPRTREQFNFALSLKKPEEKAILTMLRAMMAWTGLDNAGIIRLIVSNNIEREFQVTRNQQTA